MNYNLPYHTKIKFGFQESIEKSHPSIPSHPEKNTHLKFNLIIKKSNPPCASRNSFSSDLNNAEILRAHLPNISCKRFTKNNQDIRMSKRIKNNFSFPCSTKIPNLHISWVIARSLVRTQKA